MFIKRIIAEVLALLCAFLTMILPAGILAGAAANVFWPVFIVLGIISYVFARAWMYDVLEVKAEKLRSKSVRRK